METVTDLSPLSSLARVFLCCRQDRKPKTLARVTSHRVLSWCYSGAFLVGSVGAEGDVVQGRVFVLRVEQPLLGLSMLAS